MINPTYQKKAKIIYNRRIAGDYYRIAFCLPEIARAAQPGQFIMLRINQGYKPLLRRPFSIHRLVQRNTEAKGIEILYQVVGKGTTLLSQSKAGQYLDILGPLGNGFNCQTCQSPILIGGGMGIAPLLFLAQQLSSLKPQCPTVLIGAKTKKEILSKKEFASLGLNVRISTDDGSSGFKGRVTDLLEEQLGSLKHQASTIYACGPKPMLARIAEISKQYRIPAQVSLDEYMACGLGVCLGCMVKTKAGNQAVCKQGPVFNSAEIIWKGRG